MSDSRGVFNSNLKDFESVDSDDLYDVNSFDDLPHTKKDENQLDKRNEIYTQILESYDLYLWKTLNSNSVLRQSFIIVMLFILSFIAIATFIIIYVVIKSDLDRVSIFSSVATVLASLLASFVIIPTKIAEYAFNKEETNQIGGIIKNIQEYDKNVRDDLYKRNNTKNE